MFVIAAKLDNVRLRHALRKQEQGGKQDGERLDDGRTGHDCYFIAAILGVQACLLRIIYIISGSTVRSTTFLIVRPCTMIEKITTP